jgi:hypothetical protein
MIALFLAPITKWLILGGVVVGVLTGAYFKVKHDATMQERGRWERVVAEERTRLAGAANAAVAMAEAKSEERAAALDNLKKQVIDYEAELETRDGDRCLVSADDARRLQAIR